MVDLGSSADRRGPGPLGLGVGFGLAHAASETAILGALGLGLGWRDVSVLSLVHGAAGGLLGLVLGLPLALLLRSPARCRALQSLLTGGLLLALALNLGAADSGAGRLCLGLAVLALCSLSLAEAASRLTPWRRVAAQLSFTAPAVAAGVLSTAPELGLLTEASESGLRLAAILGGSLLVLGAGVALWTGGRDRGGRGGLAPLALALLPTLLFLGPLPRPLRLHVRGTESAPAGAARTSGPDVLFVVLDTVRADHLDLFGAERITMPELTRFAREECAVAQISLATAPSSLPSHASMFTGLYSTHHGAHKPFLIDPSPPAYAYSIRRDAPVLAERLGAAGYDTAGIAANFGVLGSFGLDRGFAHYDVAPGPAYLGTRLVWLSRWRFLGRKPGGLVDRLLPQSFARRTVLFTDRVPDYRRAQEINSQARDWLSHRSERPFFLFLNYFDAHDPYLPEPDFDEHFRPEPPGIGWVGFPKRGYGTLLRGEREPGPVELDWMRAQYDAELLSLDAQLAEMFDHLREQDRWDETLVVVVSDHGEGFWEHGFLRHSTTLYQDQVGIPLLIKLPRSQSPPDAISEHLQLIDLMPTVLHQLGLPIPEAIDGTPWAQGREASLAEVFCHHPEELHLMREMTAVVKDGLKYVHVFDGSEEGREELYDLAQDPGETDDLLARGRQPATLDELRALARGLIQQRGEALERQMKEGGDAANAEMLKRLRELGYLPEEDG